ncbi:MAG: type II toxin-antitoxin system RelE/ParE family toxin [Bacteroidota bacterium]
MARSLILPVAEQDIVRLFEYHLDHSDHTAHRFADAVIEAVRQLETFPESGPAQPNLGEGIRVVHLNRYRANLYYIVAGEDDDPLVTILRVFRQERDIGEQDFE